MRGETVFKVAIIVAAVSARGVAFAAGPDPKPDDPRKQLALVRAYLERDIVKQPTDTYPGEGLDVSAAVSAFLAKLPSLPEGDAARGEAIVLARRYAKVSEVQRPLEPDYGSAYHKQAHMRLHFAWSVLQETKTLHAGMPTEELIAVLGQPTSATRLVVEWCYESTMHVNPCLRNWPNEGRLEMLNR